MAEWAFQFEGDHGATELVGLAVDARGDVALAGHAFESAGGMVDGRKDAVVMKLASHDGETLWTRNIGAHGSHEWSSAVAADTDGNFYVAGQTNGEVFDLPTGSGGDIWVAKLDGRQGTVMWGYQVGSLGQDLASSIAVDPRTGDTVVCGSTTGGLFADPGFPSGEFRVEEGEEPGAGGEKNVEPFCMRLASADGQVVWGSRLHGGTNDGLLAAAVDPSTGDVFAAGYTCNQSGGVSATDFVAVRLDGLDGSERWRTIGAGGLADEMYADIYVGDAACAVAADGMGNVVIAGNTEGALFESTGAGQDTDAFVAKLNGTDGTRLWGWQRGSEGNDYANAVAVDRSGDVYACGAAKAGFLDDDTGGGAWAGAAGGGDGGGDGGRGFTSEKADMFVAKLDGQSGVLVWGARFGSGEDDQAVGLVLGPEVSAGVGAGGTPGSQEQTGTNGENPLYLAGWTRGALYSSVPAHWQDGWAVKLPNPPPRTLGVSGALDGRPDPLPVTEAGSIGMGGTGTQSPTSDPAIGAVTAGFVSTVLGMVIVVAAALFLVLRRALYFGGSLTATRHDPAKGALRRRARTSSSDGGGMKGVGSGGKSLDGVELTLLSSEVGDGGSLSPHAPSRHGGVTGGGAGAGGGAGVRRDASPPPSAQQATFYL